MEKKGQVVSTKRLVSQMVKPSVLSTFKLKFLALQKLVSTPYKKNTSRDFFDFCLPLFYATFQCGRLQYIQKNFIFLVV